jgi:hypothetical protein
MTEVLFPAGDRAFDDTMLKRIELLRTQEKEI